MGIDVRHHPLCGLRPSHLGRPLGGSFTSCFPHAVVIGVHPLVGFLSLGSMAFSSSAAVLDADDEVKVEDAEADAKPLVASSADAGLAEDSASLADIDSQSQSQTDATFFACSSRSPGKIRADLLQRGCCPVVVVPALLC